MKRIVFLLLFTLSQSVHAQEMWGISNSNFAGIMGLRLNPSSIVGAPYRFEYNFISGDMFAENRMAYYEPRDRSLSIALFKNANRFVQEFDESQSKQVVTASSRFYGPSFISNRGDRALSIHTAYRRESSTIAPSAASMRYWYNDTIVPSTTSGVSTGKFNTVYADWFELGGTYGKVYGENEKHYIKWGITANILAGLNAYSLNATDINLSRAAGIPGTVIGRSEFTLNRALNNNNSVGLNGLGVSADAGITYIRKRNPGGFDCNKSNDGQRKYKYRIGLSLIDIGTIHYFSKNTLTTVRNSVTSNWQRNDTLSLSNLGEIDSLLIRNFNATIEEKAFNIWLPLGVSLQFDYQIRANVFANVSWMNRIGFADNQIRRTNSMNISARYEKRNYEINLNYSLYDYSQSSAGLALRYRFIVIGTDRLFQMTGLTNPVKAYDIFFGFKFQLCNSPFEKGPDCPAFR